LIVENWGADGFEAARSWAGLANVWSHMHEGPRARDAIDRATAIVDRIRGAGDWGHIEIYSIRAAVLSEIDDKEGAILVYRDLVERLAREHPGTWDEANAATEFGATLEATGRCSESLPMLDRAIEHARALPVLTRTLLEVERARCRLTLGHAVDAARDLSAAWGSINPAELERSDRARAEEGLARALLQIGEGDRALDMARRARTDFATDSERTRDVESLDRMIARLQKR